MLCLLNPACVLWALRIYNHLFEATLRALKDGRLETSLGCPQINAINSERVCEITVGQRQVGQLLSRDDVQELWLLSRDLAEPQDEYE